MRLYNKATSMQKDYQKIPQDLLQLRSSLDMADRIIKP